MVLPRDWQTFLSGAFGPLEPIRPVSIDTPRDGEDRPGPRRFPYPVGWNLPTGVPGSEGLKLAPYNQLRYNAEAYSILRSAINVRIGEVIGLDWDVVPTADAEKAMRNNGKAYKDFSERRKKAVKFFNCPDRRFRNFQTWLGALLEDLFVTDAMSIHLQPSRKEGKGPFGSDLGALNAIDGTTIRPLLSIDGSPPRPPNPAYQQYLYGVPRVDMLDVILETDIDDTLSLAEVKKYRSDQLLYLPYCYSADTEVLTETGWKLFTDVDIAVDRFATRNMNTKAFEWQAAFDFTEVDYNGEMISFGGKTLANLLVTPNHRMLYTHGAGKAEFLAPASQVEMLKSAKMVATSLWSAPDVDVVTFRSQGRGKIWVHGDVVKSRRKELGWTQDQLADKCGRPHTTIVEYERPGWHQGKSGIPFVKTLCEVLGLGFDEVVEPSEITLSGDDYAAFMGAFLAEGCVTGSQIGIAQTLKGKGRVSYEALLRRLSIRLGMDDQGFYFTHHAFSDFLRQFGKSWEKHIPQNILGMSARQLGVFWDHYWMGDGSGDGKRQQTYIKTSSRRMADQLQEVAQKLGYSAHISLDDNPGVNGFESRHPCYRVNLLRSQNPACTQTARVPYEGKVYCVSVPNEVIYVRRGGRAIWCGNTQRTWTPYGFGPVERCILPTATGLARQKWQLEWFCYDDQTEVLTRNGWKPFSKVEADDAMASRSVDGEFQWQNHDGLNQFWYEGNLVSFQNKGVDIVVTPNHQMLVRTKRCPNSEAGKPFYLQADLILNNPGLIKKYEIPLDCHWIGEEPDSEFHLPAAPRIGNRGTGPRELRIPVGAWSAFLGLYLAEGHISGTEVIISQASTSRHYVEIEEILKATGLRWYRQDPPSGGSIGGSWGTSHKTLALYLSSFGDRAWTKRIPAEVKEYPPRLLAEFVRGAMLGDGTIGRNGRLEYITTSLELAEVMQEIWIKLGWDTCIDFKVPHHTTEGKRLQYIVRQRVGTNHAGRRMLPRPVEIPYSGYVYCVSVPNNNLLVRRNGKYAWCGNTDGSIPGLFVCPGPDVSTPDQVMQLQETLNAIAGDTAWKHRIIVLPSQSNVIPQKNMDLSDGFDEVLYTQVLMACDVMPNELGITPKTGGPITLSGSSTADQQQEIKERKALRPLLWFLKKAIFDFVLQDVFHQEDMEWSWIGLEQGEDLDMKTNMLVQQISHALRSIDEARVELGMTPWGLAETSEPVLVTPTGVIPVQGGVTASNAFGVPTPGSKAPGQPPGGPEAKTKNPVAPPQAGPPNPKPTLVNPMTGGVAAPGGTPSHNTASSVKKVYRFSKHGGSLEERELDFDIREALVSRSYPALEEKILAKNATRINTREGFLRRQLPLISLSLAALAASLRKGEISVPKFIDSATAEMARSYEAAYQAGSLAAVDEFALPADAIPDFSPLVDKRAGLTGDPTTDGQRGFLIKLAAAILAAEAEQTFQHRLDLYASTTMGAYEEGYGKTLQSTGDDYSIIWRVRDEGDCDLCKARDNQSYTFEDLPGYPGDGGFGEHCRGGARCRCYLQFVQNGKVESTAENTARPYAEPLIEHGHEVQPRRREDIAATREDFVSSLPPDAASRARARDAARDALRDVEDLGSRLSLPWSRTETQDITAPHIRDYLAAVESLADILKLQFVGGESEIIARYGAINPASALLGATRGVSKADPYHDDHGRFSTAPSGHGEQTSPHAVGVDLDPNSKSLLTLTPGKQPDESAEAYNDRLFAKGQEHYAPDRKLESAASRYRASLGLPDPAVGDWTKIEADWTRAKELGDAFATAKSNPNDPQVKAAYGDLVKQATNQWHLLTDPPERGGLGVKVDFVSPEDIRRDYGDKEGLNPYQTAGQQAHDLIANHHLAIASISDYPTAYHPLLTCTRGGEYDTFRAVHDAFGHAAVGADFTRHGEFQAWLHHSSMFSGPARIAASTELTGENSFLITHHAAATHKAALLPHNLIAMPWDHSGHFIPDFWEKLYKHNPNHDARGRFTSGPAHEHTAPHAATPEQRLEHITYERGRTIKVGELAHAMTRSRLYSDEQVAALADRVNQLEARSVREKDTHSRVVLGLELGAILVGVVISLATGGAMPLAAAVAVSHGPQLARAFGEFAHEVGIIGHREMSALEHRMER